MYFTRSFTYHDAFNLAAYAAVVSETDVSWPNDGMSVDYVHGALSLRFTAVNAGMIGSTTSLETPWDNLDIGEQNVIVAAALALGATEFRWGLNEINVRSKKKSLRDNLIALGVIAVVGVLIYLAKR